MTEDICGADNRAGEPCKRPAGWGTDHVGEGRCKLHGGNAGAPEGNQNAAKHALNSDPHHYFKSLSSEERAYIEKIASVIEDRIRENTGKLGPMDRTMARMIAIKIHIAWKASDHIANESGLMQETGDRTEPAPLFKEFRRYNDSIFRNLQKIDALIDY
jgi:hypothetical protein